MKEKFKAKVKDGSYKSWNGWVEQTVIEPYEGADFEDRINKFVGKKVIITIEEIK